MRISNDMTYQMMKTNVLSTQQAISSIQEKIASGKNINRSSDDPGTFETISMMRTDFDNIQQYLRNAEQAKLEFLTMDTALQEVLTIFHRASELTVSAGSEIASSDELTAIGEEINVLLETLVGVANSSEKGRYVFAGLRTDTTPFTTVDGNGDGYIDSVTYNGNQEIHTVQVGKNTFIETSVPGANAAGTNAVFQVNGNDLFDNLIQLRDKLLSGTSATDGTDLAAMNNNLDHIVNILGITGARAEQLQINMNMLNNQESNTLSAIDSLESIDVAEAMMELSRQQLAYEAALRATSGILNQNSLVNWI